MLQALRSHDDRFHALVNQLELNKKKPTGKLDIISVTDPTDAGSDGSTTGEKSEDERRQESVQAVLEFPTDQFRDAMYARIVQKVGERRYWETWAKDVADIAAAHVARINGLLADPESNPAREFEEFLKGLRGNLNENVTRDEAIDMLAQHLVTRPIFEALFSGEQGVYDFAATNPVAKTMELMLASLDEHNLANENETLEKFYDSVRRRVEGVDNAEGKQRILVELYDKFFSVAFKKTVDKLGIVYTPVEIVDFILRSADAVLRAEFGQGLTDEGVHILDGFTGTGTFLVRLLQSGLIEPHDLARKYAHELHGNEILLLAYYIACVNIEQTYAELTGEEQPFPGLILTDTFQSWEPDDRPDLEVFPENNARLEHLKSLPITVIVGNPPYSSGQDSANDDNANEKYPALDEEIRRTYAERSTATLKNSLYDSYIRAIKWATLRIAERGVIAYVTNGGFLDSNTADGMRKTLVEEFTSIHVYNLRGNQRTAGEQSRREGGKVFGGGSRATVAITLLVKNPDSVVEERGTSVSKPPATIHYTDIGDYLTREEKLAKVAAVGSVEGLEPVAITPNDHGDWLNQRRDDFVGLLPLDEKGAPSLFGLSSGGLKTNRSAWVYNTNRVKLVDVVERMIDTFNREVRKHGGADEALVPALVNGDPTLMSWDVNTYRAVARNRESRLDREAIRASCFRPFERDFVYFHADWNPRQGRLPAAFPRADAKNFGILVVAATPRTPFSALMLDGIPDLSYFMDAGQFFPRYRYEPVDDSGMLDLGGVSAGSTTEPVIDGYRRIDNITDGALARFRAAYPNLDKLDHREIGKDDIFFYVYGLLHSLEYRETYAADLKKMLPRIPFAADFRAFADAGRALSELHLGYESVTPYPLDGLHVEPTGDPYEFFAVGDKKMRFGKPGTAKAAGEKKDRTVIEYNNRITLSGIPEDAYRYLLGSRSAIEWIIDRYYIKTDKASGIVNDPNDWSREVGDARYILDLLARVVTVSLETMAIVNNLPALDIIDANG